MDHPERDDLILRKAVDLATFYTVKWAAISMSNPRADSHGKKEVPFDSKTASQSPPQSNL